MDIRSAPIAIYDSGDGALTVLAALRKAFPHERWILVRDRRHVPYGNKSPEQLHRFGRDCLDRVAAIGVKAAVVACHTSSALALPYLQACYDFPLLGMLEPTAQGLAQYTANTSIAWLATAASVKADLLLPRARALGFQGDWRAVACRHWAEHIEMGMLELELRDMVKQTLHSHLEWLVVEKVCILYGCTHYPLLDAIVAEYLAEYSLASVSRIDPALWVVQALDRLLRAEGLQAPVDIMRNCSVTLA